MTPPSPATPSPAARPEVPAHRRPVVVLLADRTLSARYDVLFEGIFATMQTTAAAPEWMMRRLLAPPVRTDAAGRAAAVPLGLRRVEASLLAETPLEADEVVCTTPEGLDRVLGPHVRVVGVSSSDPLGGGMSNTTTARFAGGQPYTRVWTDRLMTRLGEAKRRWGFKVIAGGAGAWQYGRDPAAAARHGIDCVFEGYFEGDGPRTVMDLVERRPVAGHVVGRGVWVDRVRPLRGPAVLGSIELTRGCGRGCRFCAMGTTAMEDLAPEVILADLATNVAGGQTNIVSTSEDFFRYGARGGRVNFEALRALLVRMREVRPRRFLQIDHANVSSVVQLSDAALHEVRRLLAWEGESEYLWVNLGAESASGRLVQANGPGKLGGADPDTWETMIEESVARLERCGFFPVLSVILGLPGETPADVARTRQLVGRLAARRAVVFPIFYEPVRPDDGEAFSLARMRADHLDLFTACYEANFRWVPRLYADNQRAGGVAWWKRTLLQVLGRAEIVTWRRRFVRLGREIAARGNPRADKPPVAPDKGKIAAAHGPAAATGAKRVDPAGRAETAGVSQG